MQLLRLISRLLTQKIDLRDTVITYLFIDIDGVLIQGMNKDPKLQRPWDKNLMRDLGIDPAQLSKVFFEPFFSRILAGEIDLKDCLKSVMPELNSSCKVSDLIEYWYQGDSQVSQELLDYISCLGSQFRKIIISNQEPGRAEFLWKQLGFNRVFSDAFFSYQFGCTKPNPRFFSQVLSELELRSNSSSSIIYFDDDLANIQATLTLGWDSVQYRSIRDFLDHPVIKENLAL